MPTLPITMAAAPLLVLIVPGVNSHKRFRSPGAGCGIERFAALLAGVAEREAMGRGPLNPNEGLPQLALTTDAMQDRPPL